MQIPYKDRQIEAEEVAVVGSREPWCEYQLADGKTFKIKSILVTMLKAKEDKDNDGNPIYIWKTHAVGVIE